MAIIYLSSTYSDLKNQRQAAYHVLQQMRYTVIAMEDYVATDQRPLEKCLAEVATCDLYIGIFAWRYGYIPDGESNPDHRSITELEYRKAVQTGKPCLIFMLTEDASWPFTATDAGTKEGDGGARILALRDELAKEKLVNFFSTPDNLATQVSAAVYNWEHTQVVSSNTDPSANNGHGKIEQEARLKTLLIDQRNLLDNSLSNFVGRDAELAELRRLIKEKTRTGGYITITGQAGQGKSSIIAKLVTDAREEMVAHHFIPLNPGPDYQVNLLRDLMARLILKYQFIDLYVTGENRAVLRNSFAQVLARITAEGKQEVICIDGLDQLREELDGERDLSFLPDDPPPGIVFVLGTRPDDVIESLMLSRPSMNYALPYLSRHDFGLILQHHRVVIGSTLADRYYEAMQKNVLYLDLIARELAQKAIENPEEMIKRVTDNPQNLFSLSMARLKRRTLEWREIIKPVLGTLLVAREPLTRRQIRQIIGVEDQRLGEGLTRLGGLVAKDGQDRYALFHSKLQDYLRQDEHKNNKEYIFAADEEQTLHKKLADWCEQSDLSLIWVDRNGDRSEQSRREYARRYYVNHLYDAQEWTRLFAVLDDGAYGKAKVRYDPSTHSYMQDLDLGRRAIDLQDLTHEQRIEALLRLWRYTLLRCNLVDRVDHYPLTAFRMLVVLKREQEALDLAEMLTGILHKARVLFEIAKLLEQRPERRRDHIQLLLKVFKIVSMLEKGTHQIQLLEELGVAFASAQQWEQARNVIQLLEKYRAEAETLATLSEKYKDEPSATDIPREARSLREVQALEHVLEALGVSFAQTQQWQRAAAIANALREWSSKALVLQALGFARARAQQWEQAEEAWNAALALLSQHILAQEKVIVLCEIGLGFASLQLWERANIAWHQATVLACNAKVLKFDEQIRALCWLAETFVQVQRWEQAQQMWTIALTTTRAQGDTSSERQILRKQSLVLARAGQWPQAKIVARLLAGTGEEILHELLIVLAQRNALSQGRKIRISGRVLPLLKNHEHALSVYEIAMIAVQAHLWQTAEALIHMILPSDERLRAWRNLGVALAQRQEWERAEAVVSLLEDADGQASVIHALLRAFVQDGQWERAETLARGVGTSDEKSWMLCELVVTFAQAQKWQIADKLWRELEALPYKKDGNWSWLRSRALHELILALALAQQWERAEQLVGEINELGKKAQTQRELALALAKAQQWWRAKVLLGTIDNLVERARGIREMVAVLGKMQQWEQAEALIHTTKETEIKDGALRELILALTQARQWKHAETLIGIAPLSGDPLLRILAVAQAQAQLWDEAEKIAATIKERWQKANALRWMVAALAQAQQLERAEALAQTIQMESERSWALHELGIALAQAQRWEQSEHAAYELSVDWQRAAVLCELGSALAQADQLDHAEAIWIKAEAVALSIGDHRKRAEALRKLGIALVQAQQYPRAQVVWLAAREVAYAIEKLSERDRPLRDRMLNLPQNVTVDFVSSQEAFSLFSSLDAFGLELLRPQPLRELVMALAQAHQWEQIELVIHMIEDRDEKSATLRELVATLTQLHQWLQAETIIHAVTEGDERVSFLLALANMLAQSYQQTQLERIWSDIEALAYTTMKYNDTVQVLHKLAESMTKAEAYEQLSLLIQRAWLGASRRSHAIKLLSLSTGLIALKPEMGLAFCEAFTWTDMFLATWVDASLNQ